MSGDTCMLSARVRVAGGHKAKVGQELQRLAGAARAVAGVVQAQVLANRAQNEFLLQVQLAAQDDEAKNLLPEVVSGLQTLWLDGLLERDPFLELWQSVQDKEQAPRAEAAETASPPAGQTVPAAAAGTPGRGLYAPGTLGPIRSPNRIVRSATWEGLADDSGAVTPALVDVYAKLADGGVGLVITGHTYVTAAGRAAPWQMGVHTDAMLPGLRQVAGAIRSGGAAAVLQLAHGGCNVVPQQGEQAEGPSGGQGDFGAACREMSLQDIRRVTLDFAKGAVRGKQAGFNGVQVHAAHGYLLSQFLTPAVNKRSDRYGGNLEGRARMLLETVQLVRDAVGDDFGVLVKLNVEDFRDNGLTLEESLEVADQLQEAGMDGLELSGGTPATLRRKPRPDNAPYYLEQALLFRERLSVPVILTGGVRSQAVAADCLARGAADYVGLSRALIHEPGLPNIWREHRPTRGECISCNECMQAALQGRGLECIQHAPAK